MIRCEIPLKLITYICYELNKAYQDRKHIFVLRSSKKKTWIWNIYMEIRRRLW